MMTDDLTLVQSYAREGSEEAFASLVSRHVNLVYSVALRQIRDSHLAEEVTQTVFVILARKASSIRPPTIVSAWLCRTARYVSECAGSNEGDCMKTSWSRDCRRSRIVSARADT